MTAASDRRILAALNNPQRRRKNFWETLPLVGVEAFEAADDEHAEEFALGQVPVPATPAIRDTRFEPMSVRIARRHAAQAKRDDDTMTSNERPDSNE